jgi:hypothetical protein
MPAPIFAPLCLGTLERTMPAPFRALFTSRKPIRPLHDEQSSYVWILYARSRQRRTRHWRCDNGFFTNKDPATLHVVPTGAFSVAIHCLHWRELTPALRSWLLSSSVTTGTVPWRAAITPYMCATVSDRALLRRFGTHGLYRLPTTSSSLSTRLARFSA